MASNGKPFVYWNMVNSLSLTAIAPIWRDAPGYLLQDLRNYWTRGQKPCVTVLQPWII